ncbi:MAG: trypsin-like peptidase domain-containing protein [Xenococcaceae cyanobacterium MO_207.B15]|nr:trypsin-like peptidase domain-containing protein [Xenococcaceae cyanobacterium MO_207.B15]
MGISGSQHEKLSIALRDAFQTPQRFLQFVKFRFDKNLYDITIAEDLQELAFDLIREADSYGWIEELIIGARQSNPKNAKLFAFSQEFFSNPYIANSLPSELAKRGSLEKIIRAKNSFLTVTQWREKLGAIEAQVCRVEVKQSSGGYKPLGTGFLIGADVAITNYHVVESVITEKIAPEDIILRFDYKQLRDGITVNSGKEYELLLGDWLIDYSLYPPDEEKREPKENELDYAILRIDGEPGNQLVGERGSPERGWIKLPKTNYDFVADTPLFIVQHPQGTPLKLAFDTESIIGLNSNKTVVKYRTNTERGSSGSPCFNIDWELVALHHSGDTLYENKTPQFNAGTPFSAIVSRLREQNKLANL